MTTRIGINGFGRTGRQVLRATIERHPAKLEVAAINNPSDARTDAHLFKYDTTYGIYPGTVEAVDGSLVVDGRHIKVFADRDPARIPWAELGVDIVIECTGSFTDAKKAAAHLKGGAKKVIISAAAHGEDLTMVLGVNEERYDRLRHHVVSNASCTTNCVAPMVKVLHEAFGIEHALMSTIHAYTNDQRLLDHAHEDLRRARSAAQNIIPTTTGAARSVGVIIPELQGKINGMAFRVPVADVSITDLVAVLKRGVTAKEVNAAYQAASRARLKGILDYTEEPLVSSDFKGNTFSCVIDGLSTMVMGGTMVKVLGWYDNEWGYACRTSDLAAFMADQGV